WLAGGGIRGGMTYGATDEVGHKAAENVVTPNDYQATVLHLLGLDHEKVVYHANGQEHRLTAGRPARVVKEILQGAVAGHPLIPLPRGTAVPCRPSPAA